MDSKVWRLHLFGIFTLLEVLNVTRCSTTSVVPPAPPEVPAYAAVPHPQGMDTADLEALFIVERAPRQPDFAKTCDGDFNNLNNLIKSVDERTEGVLELVKNDPVYYHWCFYGKLLDLDRQLKQETFIDEKQKLVLTTFEFLAPIARAFLSLYHDARYLHWASYKYQKISEWIFLKKLELTPAGTSELVQASNPFGLWRDSEGYYGVLEKYHIDRPKPLTIESTPVPAVEATPSPTTESTPSPSVSETPTPIPTPFPTPTQLPSPAVSPLPSKTPSK